MLQKFAYIIIILVGCYVLYQIPIIKESADAIQSSFIEKRDNAVNEYQRVKEKVDGVTEKVVDTTEKVENTAKAVNSAVNAVGETADKISGLVGSDKEEEKTDSAGAEKGVCTEGEKAAKMCTMDYNPVCGDDGITYGNKCGACASGKVNTYTIGECVAK
jgi:hypothetical protein